MAMGKKPSSTRQRGMWVATQKLPRRLQGRVLSRHFSLFGAKTGRWLDWNRLWAPIGLDQLFGASQTHQYTLATSDFGKNDSRRNQDFCHGLVGPYPRLSIPMEKAPLYVCQRRACFSLLSFQILVQLEGIKGKKKRASLNPPEKNLDLHEVECPVELSPQKSGITKK